MKKLITVMALCAAAFAIPAHATTHKEAPNMAAGASAPQAMSKQNTKMADCNKEAGEKKGDERKAFMKTCLSAKKVTQQDKMKSCNKEATGKTGDDRKAFMKTCLSA
jgi:psiF repeat